MSKQVETPPPVLSNDKQLPDCESHIDIEALGPVSYPPVMAKVRVFKDRRPGVEIRRRPQPYSRPQPQEAEQQDKSPTPEEEGVLQATQRPPQGR